MSEPSSPGSMPSEAVSATTSRFGGWLVRLLAPLLSPVFAYWCERNGVEVFGRPRKEVMAERVAAIVDAVLNRPAAEASLSAAAASCGNDGQVLAPVAEQRLDPADGGEFVPKNFTLHFSTPFRARVVQVVLVDAMRGGSGPDDPDDPTRGVCQYWSLDGQLLADTDDGGLGLAADGRGVEILRLRGLLKAMREELAALKAAKGAPC